MALELAAEHGHERVSFAAGALIDALRLSQSMTYGAAYRMAAERLAEAARTEGGSKVQRRGKADRT